LESDGRATARRVVPAIILNLSAGLIYGWSLFAAPLERALAEGRGTLSLVPSIALAVFTLGMVICPRIFAAVGSRGLTLLIYLLAPAGFALFALYPSFATLVVGYGLCFGLAAGLAYGLALALAVQVDDRHRAVAIGIVMGAFALCGILLPALGGWIAATPPPRVFLYLAFAGIVGGALVHSSFIGLAVERSAAATSENEEPYLTLDFAKLSLIFFLVCFVGLMTISHLKGVALADGLSEREADLTTSLFPLGYLAGSISGGALAERFGGRATLCGASGLTILGLFGLALAELPLVAFAGAFAIGLTFGGSASFMPTLIALRFGPARVTKVYGKMMIGYGAAGLVAPKLAGVMFESGNSYAPALGLGGIMALSAAILGLSLKPERQSEA
jgi:OFA family oxalate/formate antiporter-like MFS transporter